MNRFAKIFLVLTTFVLVVSPLFADPTQEELEAQYRDILQNSPQTLSGLNPVQRKDLYRLARHDKIAAVEMLSVYDPTGLIGFCFGRAMTVHLIARKMGLRPESLRKLFVLGDMRSGNDPEWRFHVTTLVLGTDKKWYAIDPIMDPPLASGTPLLMKKWMDIVDKKWIKQRDSHYYVVSANAVMPDVRELPELKKEMGIKAIEITFKPTTEKGFTKYNMGGSSYKIYTLSDVAEHFHFLTLHNPKPKDRFPLLALQINADTYDFNQYFVDLFNNLEKPLVRDGIGERGLPKSEKIHWGLESTKPNWGAQGALTGN